MTLLKAVTKWLINYAGCSNIPSPYPHPPYNNAYVTASGVTTALSWSFVPFPRGITTTLPTVSSTSRLFRRDMICVSQVPVTFSPRWLVSPPVIRLTMRVSTLSPKLQGVPHSEASRSHVTTPSTTSMCRQLLVPYSNFWHPPYYDSLPQCTNLLASVALCVSLC